MLKLTGLNAESKPDPYTSVLVLNIGATRGPRCPEEHWLYIPDSVSGFHRVGFYSNVDKSFLPFSSREKNDRISIYVERSYPGGQKPYKAAMEKYSKAVIAELRDWGYIDQPDVIDPTWIDVAYTWSWAASNWRSRALQILSEHDIFQAGRYGRWLFQGIADSIREGFSIGTKLAGTSDPSDSGQGEE
jgi:protoporphyrinogen oxidase